ncbi:RagB/SusD family nutrient uptake outer membrane protein [Chitinophaga filiformis]|uniref:RagB/SusD family nutrient uptake outer membrane protein n=1 Tax=Chitinophaga filiformis TaxID=104663 RepID=A0ABY4HXB1_CHIFI|nr:RagB/SusD family nutrient uptake outer membrane protein [Chitinophaga filiformis]UPK68068.1 RagB/SusD family nutrient uptake outer membrane protein [Chitinophaga filiformis]
MARIYIFIFIGVIVFCSGCKKGFLDVTPSNQVESGKYISNLAACETVLNGAYVELKTRFYTGYAFIYGELVADNMKPIISGTPLTSHYAWRQIADETNSYQMSSSSSNLNPFWISGYHMLREVALVLENVDRFKQEDSVKANNLKGQALALRALAHLQLLNYFSQQYNYSADASHAGIPYVTASDWNTEYTRNTVSDNYKQILNDLQIALTLLPANVLSNQVLTKTAVQALIARVYLNKGEYALAKDMAVSVLTKVPLMVTGYPENLFTNKESEAIFQLSPPLTELDQRVAFPGYYFRESFKYYGATKDIALLLTQYPTDIRRAWVKDTAGAWEIRKYPTGIVANSKFPTTSYYQTLIRSSEMYLIAAEAFAQNSMKDSSLYYLNAIRVRAYGVNSAIDVSGGALLDSIYMERRKELCFEGNRLYDLSRQKKAIKRADVADNVGPELLYPNDRYIAPIPLSDVLVKGLNQNKDY